MLFLLLKIDVIEHSVI